ncbi:MAG: tandem-95 repeat protein, partial [Chryseolinea sp.]
MANDDIFSTPEDTEVTQNLVSNDTDPGFGIDPTTVDLDISSPLIVDNTITTADGTFSVDASGILTFVPTQDFFGTTFIQYTVRNTDAIPATSSPANIQINVTAVNDAPVISALTDIAVNENTTSPAEAFSVSDIDNPAASLLVTAASNNPTLLPLTGIELVHVSGGDWTVAVTPAVGRAGNATVTLTLTDGSKTDKGTFAVTVTIPGNDNPVITPISNQNINEDTSTGAIAFTISDTETPVASLTIDAVSGNTSLVPTGRISILGTGGNLTIEVTPLPNVFGTATISLNLADADGGTAFEQFEVVVASVNDIPTITTIANQSINEDGVTPSLPFTIGDVETPAAGLTILKSSNDLSIVPLTGIAITGSGAARNVVVTPLTNKFGNVRITLTVRDVDGGEVVQEFDVDIASVNDLPQISAIADQVINEDESTAALSFNVSDIETGATSLNVTTSSTNISIVPLANIVITGTGGTRSVVVTPVANLTGAVDITLIVEDADGGKTPEIFKVTINPVNDAPAISALSDISVNENTTSAAFAFAVSDIDNSAAVLSVTAGSNNTTLLPVAGINLVHVAAGDWTVAVTPTADQTGTATVTLTVSDGAKTVEGTFLVTVNAVANTNPTISAIADQNINEDGSTVSLPFTIGDTETPVASLTVSKASSDVSIVPLTGIAITGTGPALNVTVTPLPN